MLQLPFVGQLRWKIVDQSQYGKGNKGQSGDFPGGAELLRQILCPEQWKGWVRPGGDPGNR